MASGRRKSEIWSYFTVKENAHYVKYNKCKEQISQGGRNTKIFNTTNLVQYLQKHKKKYETEKDTNSLKRITDSEAIITRGSRG